MFFTMMGKCIDQDASTNQNLDFSAVVRKMQKKEVTITNTEDKEWAINPTISTESYDCNGYFVGKPTLNIAPKQ